MKYKLELNGYICSLCFDIVTNLCCVDSSFSENYNLECLKYSGAYLKLHLMVLKPAVKSGVPGEVFVAVQSAHSAFPCFCCDFGPFLATMAAHHRCILPFP